MAHTNTACTFRTLPTTYFRNSLSRYHGSGEFAEEDGSLYTGTWSHGQRAGQGSQVNNRERHEYTGSFLDDLYHGTGRCQWVNGSVYEGSWVKGTPNGAGVYAFAVCFVCLLFSALPISALLQYPPPSPISTVSFPVTSRQMAVEFKALSRTALRTAAAADATKTTTSAAYTPPNLQPPPGFVFLICRGQVCGGV